MHIISTEALINTVVWVGIHSAIRFGVLDCHHSLYITEVLLIKLVYKLAGC